jgi:hypothetical protein
MRFLALAVFLSAASALADDSPCVQRGCFCDPGDPRRGGREIPAVCYDPGQRCCPGNPPGSGPICRVASAPGTGSPYRIVHNTVKGGGCNPPVTVCAMMVECRQNPTDSNPTAGVAT